MLIDGDRETAWKGVDYPIVGGMLTQEGLRWNATGTSLELTSWEAATAPGGTVSTVPSLKRKFSMRQFPS